MRASTVAAIVKSLLVNAVTFSVSKWSFQLKVHIDIRDDSFYTIVFFKLPADLKFESLFRLEPVFRHHMNELQLLSLSLQCINILEKLMVHLDNSKIDCHKTWSGYPWCPEDKLLLLWDSAIGL